MSNASAPSTDNAPRKMWTERDDDLPKFMAKMLVEASPEELVVTKQSSERHLATSCAGKRHGTAPCGPHGQIRNDDDGTRAQSAR